MNNFVVVFNSFYCLFYKIIHSVLKKKKNKHQSIIFLVLWVCDKHGKFDATKVFTFYYKEYIMGPLHDSLLKMKFNDALIMNCNTNRKVIFKMKLAEHLCLVCFSMNLL